MEFDGNILNWIILVLCIAIYHVIKALLFDDSSRRFMMMANRSQPDIERALKAYGLTLIEIKDAGTWTWFRWPHVEFRVTKSWEIPEPGPAAPEHVRLKLVFKNRLGKICEAVADVTDDIQSGKSRIDFSPALEKFEYADRDMPL